MSDRNSNWKWGQSSQNAFKLVAQVFNLDVEGIKKLNDSEVSKVLKKADESDIQVKRVQDFVQGTKRYWRNSLKANGMIHGLIRNGLMILGQKQLQEATTTKEYAKHITGTRVLSAKTQTAVEKTYLKGAKQIEKSGKDLQRYTGEINEQYQVVEENAEKQSQQRRIGYRERAQKRLAANARPWRNY